MSSSIITKKQHYVPQFYLKNFSENKHSIGLYLFKQNIIVEHSSIINSLYENFYYDKDNKVEKKLSEFEGEWDNIIKDVLASESLPLEYKKISMLKLFILITSARTKLIGKEFNEKMSEIYNQIVKVEFPDKYKKFDVKFEHPTLMNIQAVQKLLLYVVDLKIDLLVNKSHIDFVTSDNPTIFCNQLFEYKRLSRGYGFGEFGIQFIIPISSKYAIVMYDENVYRLKTNLISSGSVIKKLNELILNNADEVLVFLCKDEEKIKAKEISYLKSLLKKKSSTKPGCECGELIVFKNKQIYGRYDLSDVFEIKDTFLTMNISDHSQDEINKKITEELEKERNRLLNLCDEERIRIIKEQKADMITFCFDDMQRPWIKRLNCLKNNALLD